VEKLLAMGGVRLAAVLNDIFDPPVGLAGRSIMEYVWPARRDRKRLEKNSGEVNGGNAFDLSENTIVGSSKQGTNGRSSLDSPRTHSVKKLAVEDNRSKGISKRLGSSRSFTDLRLSARKDSAQSTLSSGYLAVDKSAVTKAARTADADSLDIDLTTLHMEEAHKGGQNDDATEMKSRSSQKTFVLVRISSLHLLLSFRKDGSFFCRDARIQTRELEYRNQTTSFEELADQFIPSDPSWKGWVRIALHQPLVPVLPVAKELFSKTKWFGGKGRSRKLTSKRSFDEHEHRASPQRQSTEIPRQDSSQSMGTSRSRKLIKASPHKLHTGNSNGSQAGHSDAAEDNASNERND